MGQITTTQARRLAEHEATIHSGLDSWLEVTAALIAIHEENLWIGKGETFVEYCKEEFRLEKTHVYEMIESYKAREGLSAMAEYPPPPNERVAREVSRVETEQERADLWTKATDTAPNKTPTAAHVARTRKAMFPTDEKNGELPSVEPVEAIKGWIKKIDAIRRDIDEVRPLYKTKSKEWKEALDELDEGRKALLQLTK